MTKAELITENLVERLTEKIELATSICILTSFVMKSGCDLLRESLRKAAEHGADIKICTGDYLFITQKPLIRLGKTYLAAFLAKNFKMVPDPQCVMKVKVEAYLNPRLIEINEIKKDLKITTNHEDKLFLRERIDLIESEALHTPFKQRNVEIDYQSGPSDFIQHALVPNDNPNKYNRYWIEVAGCNSNSDFFLDYSGYSRIRLDLKDNNNNYVVVLFDEQFPIDLNSKVNFGNKPPLFVSSKLSPSSISYYKIPDGKSVEDLVREKRIVEDLFEEARYYSLSTNNQLI